jgi:Major Facilitator Superfamily
MSTAAGTPSAVRSRDEPRAQPPHRLALVVVGLAQLLVVLDVTIVNVALPTTQQALQISDANRQWVVTAYTLAFGGLLLLGGRIADYTGRRRALIIGLLGFGAASAMAGLATNAGWLFVSRGVQGAFAALMAPAALSLADGHVHAAASAHPRLRRLRRHLGRGCRGRPTDPGCFLRWAGRLVGQDLNATWLRPPVRPASRWGRDQSARR